MISLTSLGRLVSWVTILGVVILLIAIPDPREFARAHGTKLRISVATGGTGGVWYPLGGGIAKVITSYVPNVEATAEVTAASVDNLKLIQLGSADLGFSYADILREAYDGEATFEAMGRVPGLSLAVTNIQPTQLVTLERTGIRTFQDLRGKVVSLGAPGSGTEILARRMLTAGGIDPDSDIRGQGLSVAESVNAIRDGKVDAFFWNSAIPAGSVMDLAGTPGQTIVLIPTDEVMPALIERHGELYQTTYIPKETYRGMVEDIPTVSVAAVLVVESGTSEDLVYEITKALFEHHDELVATHPSAADLTLESAVQGSTIPYHPGAIRYYRERGVWPG